MITNSIERAQKKVEENNFGIRKRLIEYDDVMNAQREVIYKRRRNALYGERPVSESEFRSNKENDLVNKCFEGIDEHYRAKTGVIAEQVFPVIKDVHTNPNNQFENIVIPFTDGIRAIQIITNLKKLLKRTAGM
jgi:preprotein translocase subunit SecA